MKVKGEIEFRCTLYIMIFTVSSIIGWLYETILTSVRWGYFAERGFLQLPLCPIYGFGAIVLLLMFHHLKNSAVIFVVSTLVTTVIELVASYLLEYFLHMQLWTYKHWPLHFQGRISLWSSILFGALAVILIKVIYPLVKHGMEGLNRRCRIFLSIWIVGTILLDTILCLKGL